MTQVTSATYSTDPNNFIEFECAPGIWSNGSGTANNQLSYISTNGSTYTDFIQFAIKVVMVTNDSTDPPFLRDIRAIALPPGTNI
jgi:hypothetical protein